METLRIQTEEKIKLEKELLEVRENTAQAREDLGLATEALSAIPKLTAEEKRQLAVEKALKIMDERDAEVKKELEQTVEMYEKQGNEEEKVKLGETIENAKRIIKENKITRKAFFAEFPEVAKKYPAKEEIEEKEEKIESSSGGKKPFFTKRRLQVATLAAGLGVAGVVAKKTGEHMDESGWYQEAPLKKITQKNTTEREMEEIHKESSKTNMTALVEAAKKAEEERVKEEKTKKEKEMQKESEKKLAQKQAEIDVLNAKLQEAMKSKVANPPPVASPKFVLKTEEEYLIEIMKIRQEALDEGKDPDKALTREQRTMWNIGLINRKVDALYAKQKK